MQRLKEWVQQGTDGLPIHRACQALSSRQRRSYNQRYFNTAAIATAVASALDEFSPATHMRPERTR